MKKIAALFILMCSLWMSQSAFAQMEPGMNPERSMEMKKKSEELKLKLKLSEPQAAKFDEITKRYRDEARKKMMALPEDAPRQERLEIMKNAMQNADKEINEILDSDQQAIFKQEKEAMKAERKEKRKGKQKIA